MNHPGYNNYCSFQEFIRPAKLHGAYELLFMNTVLNAFAYKNMYTLLLFILIGVTLNLRGSSITTDGSGRIVITGINPDGDNNEDALICQSELSLSAGGDWYLHPTQLTTDDSDKIQGADIRGWRRNRDIVSGHRLVRLRRDDSAASGDNDRALEGVFTCDIPGDTNTPVSVGIYYPSELHVMSFNYVLLSCALFYM